MEAADFEKIDFKAIHTAIKDAEGSAKRDRLAEVIRKRGELMALAPTADEVREPETLRAALTRRDAASKETQGLLFQRLCDAAQRLLQEGNWPDPLQCPVCESHLDTPIADHVEAHLRSYAAVKVAQEEIRTAWAGAAWGKRIKSLELALSLNEPKLWDELNRAFRNGSPSLEDYEKSIAYLLGLERHRHSAIAELDAERAGIEKELPASLVTLTEQITHAETIRAQIALHKKALAGVAGATQKLAVRNRWRDFIEGAASRFAEAEVALSTAHTLSLQTEYQRLYDGITRNSDIVPLLKKASGSEELHLRLEKFYGLRDVSAATLLPESHRNALAISIFLSAVQKTVTPARFVILDDITSSFDAGHQFNVMELLRTSVATPGNPSGPQVIILSHDGLLEKYFDTLSNTKNWHHQKLQGQPPQGAVLSQTQDAQRLRTMAERFLCAGQQTEASPLVRQYLEYSLLQVIRKVDIPVPLDFSIRDDHKMAQNCLDAIREAVDLREGAGQLVLEPSQRDGVRNIYVPRLLANWITHYATGSVASLSPRVLMGVLQDVDAFVDCFRYTCTCGGGPQQRFYKNLGQKACNC